jgi:hypothetical protein
MKHFGILIALLLTASISNAQLIINELSQGTGSAEYVELLVTGTPTCGGANTVDLRGWIIDDNNSWHKTGSGAGIAGGHVRFDSISQWANVKIGSLIVIYDNSNISTFTDDVSDANNDLVYIIPVSSAVLQKNTTLPASGGSMTTYGVSTTYSTTGTWGILGMANGGDAFHTVSPANYASAYHAIGWGNNNIAVDVYFSADQASKVIYMANTVSNDPYNQANYIDSTTATSETPGLPNNAANAAWIHSLNNNNQPFVVPTVSLNNPGSISCGNSSVVLTATTTTNGATFNWSNGITTANDTITTAGTYTVTVTDAGGVCSASASATITSNAALAIAASATDATCGASDGTASVSITNGTATGYLWNTTATTASLTGLAAGTYTVTVTGGGNCSATASVTVNSGTALTVNATATNTTCGAANGTATVSVTAGTASGYLWSTTATTASINGLAAGTYNVTVTGAGNCSATASVTVTASNNASVSITSDKNIFCANDSAQVCAPSGSASYLWNTGATTSCITVKAAGNYYVTVTENGGCTATSNHLAINVYPLPPVSVSVSGDSLSAYNAVTYQWYLNNSPIQGATSSLYIAQQSGNYQVLVSDTNGCTAISNGVVVTITGITDITNETFTIYPNPLNGGNWKITAGAGMIGSTIRIYDNEGRVVYQNELREENTEIEADLARGIYMLRINNGQSSITRKLTRL